MDRLFDLITPIPWFVDAIKHTECTSTRCATPHCNSTLKKEQVVTPAIELEVPRFAHLSPEWHRRGISIQTLLGMRLERKLCAAPHPCMCRGGDEWREWVVTSAPVYLRVYLLRAHLASESGASTLLKTTTPVSADRVLLVPIREDDGAVAKCRQYRVRAIVTHIGHRPRAGKVVAYVPADPGNPESEMWLKCEPNSVQKCTLSYALNPQLLVSTGEQESLVEVIYELEGAPTPAPWKMMGIPAIHPVTGQRRILQHWHRHHDGTCEMIPTPLANVGKDLGFSERPDTNIFTNPLVVAAIYARNWEKRFGSAGATRQEVASSNLFFASIFSQWGSWVKRLASDKKFELRVTAFLQDEAGAATILPPQGASYIEHPQAGVTGAPHISLFNLEARTWLVNSSHMVSGILDACASIFWDGLVILTDKEANSQGDAIRTGAKEPDSTREGGSKNKRTKSDDSRDGATGMGDSGGAVAGNRGVASLLPHSVPSAPLMQPPKTPNVSSRWAANKYALFSGKDLSRWVSRVTGPAGSAMAINEVAEHIQEAGIKGSQFFVGDPPSNNVRSLLSRVGNRAAVEAIATEADRVVSSHSRRGTSPNRFDRASMHPSPDRSSSRSRARASAAHRESSSSSVRSSDRDRDRPRRQSITRDTSERSSRHTSADTRRDYDGDRSPYHRRDRSPSQSSLRASSFNRERSWSRVRPPLGGQDSPLHRSSLRTASEGRNRRTSVERRRDSDGDRGSRSSRRSRSRSRERGPGGPHRGGSRRGASSGQYGPRHH